jgi:drug/metabolite transporter (DMT)-like permease
MNKGILLNVVSVLIMSLSPLINKFSLGFFSPVQAALYSSIFAALFCYLYAIVNKKNIRLIKNKFIWLVGFTNAVGIILLFISLDLLSPITVGFIGRFYIVFAIMLSALILKEKFNNRDKLLICLAIVGTFLFVEKDTTGMSLIGALIALGYTFLFALTNTLVKKTIHSSDSNSILFYNNIISTIFILGFILISGQISQFSFNFNGILLIIMSSFLSGFLGLLLFYEGLKYIDFSVANLIRTCGPIFVAFYSWWFFPIELTITNILGAILLLSSVIVMSIKPKASGKIKKNNKKEASIN